jgi:hypothetical protein
MSPKKVIRALAEIAFIMLLFYTNLFMGEFTRSRHMPTLLIAFFDLFTLTNALIGLIGAIIGYFCIEWIRRRL